MEEFIQTIRESTGSLANASTIIILLMIIIAGLIVFVSVVSMFTSIMLAVSYISFNHRKNSLRKRGREIARDVLDKNGLTDISVRCSGSILFGNSYSHFFRKVRLRRLTWRKSSVSALAMAYQKSHLAVLDKNGDPDMKRRIAMTPIIYFGPLALIPLILLGLILDFIVFQTDNGIFTLICILLGFSLYVVAFVMSLMVLKTEKKAQEMALISMAEDGVSESDIRSCKKLFRLYNIEYVNDMIIAFLEMIYRMLQLISSLSSKASSSKK